MARSFWVGRRGRGVAGSGRASEIMCDIVWFSILNIFQKRTLVYASNVRII